MKIETKFDIGDCVYRLNKRLRSKHVTCTYCKGKKRFTAVEKTTLTFNCPECKGTGKKADKISSKYVWEVVDALKEIAKIEIQIKKHETIEELFTGHCFPDVDPSFFGEANECYKTAEEAQAECDKRNKDGLKE